MMIRRIRILLMLVLLLIVAGSAWLSGSRTMNWDRSLWVAVYPIVGDDTSRTRKYATELQRSNFAGVERFFQRQSESYGLNVSRPVSLHVYHAINDHPPAVPESKNPLAIAYWSLHLKLWAWWQTRGSDLPTPDIKIFMVLRDPGVVTSVSHSLGLRNGLLGIVNGFASRRHQQTNNVVVAHELMHTLGASDKYWEGSNYPVWPDGFADPDQYPPLPQSEAEIMGGRIPVDNETSHMPPGLLKVVVGNTSAREIGWL